MRDIDFLYLTPELIVTTVPLIIMVTIAIKRNYKVIYGFSLLAFTVAFASLFLIPVLPHQISGLLIFDGFTHKLSAIILLTCIVVILLSRSNLVDKESEKEEYFIILFVAALGALLLVAANNFVTLFLGIETLSISLYILVAYRRSLGTSIEAGVKYLVLASVSSAFLLFGMGLIYAYTGSLEFNGIAGFLVMHEYYNPLFAGGFAMMMVGIGFKLALVPFHMWTPDVYEGAPVPIATFIATVSKGSVLVVLFRFFYAVNGFANHYFIFLISLFAILSMFIGNLLAIRQQNLKRILAYSSISNMGYILVTLLVGTEEGISAAIFYILSYIITILAAFTVIAMLSESDNDRGMIENYRGLFWKKPLVAMALTLAMLSLAGIPLTTGFMAKFYVVFTGINSGLWLLVISLIISSVIGLYYYLRVVAVMFSTANEDALPKIPLTGQILLTLLSVGILWLGLFPQWMLHYLGR